MSYFQTRNYGLEVARGAISGQTGINKFGRNPDVDVGTEDVWGTGGIWIEPTAATTVAFVSSSAADAAAGTGARTLTVNGLNGSYADTTETLTLNGVTPVNTSNSYFIIHRVTVATAGSGGTNAGTITTAWTGGGTPVGPSIVIGKGQTQFCIYQIPAGLNGYLSSFGGSYSGASTSNITLELFAKPFGGAWNLKGSMDLAEQGTTFARRTYDTPLKFTEKTIIKVTATSDTVNSDVVASFDLITL